MLITALAAVGVGILIWSLIQTYIGERGVPIPRPRPDHVSVASAKPVGRKVKTFAVGPDPFAEPDPLKPYQVKSDE
jgi:hypothetical protein